MKKIILILLLSPNLFSQRIAQNKIDEFTGDRIIKVDASTGKNWNRSDNVAKGLANNIFISSKFIGSSENLILTTLDFQLSAQICLSNYDGKLIILFNDSSKITFPQISKVDCNTNLNADFSLGNSYPEQLKNLKMLSEKILQKIRIYTSDGYLDFEIKEKKQDIVKKHFKLLYEETIKIQ